MSLLLAQSGRAKIAAQCPLSEVKRTSQFERVTSAYDPKRTTASCFSRLSRQGRNHHNFNEHPRSPKVRGEASPHRRICRIDPFIPNRIVIFEQTHVSDPDLGA